MAIVRWHPSTTVSRQEAYILKRCEKKRKLFSFLRKNRARLFDDDVQSRLEQMYRETGAGREPLCPAMMAMALVLQGYLGVSDADAVELSVVDLRWQMALDRMGESRPAFSQGALFEFRERLIAHDLDRWLLQRTAEVARSTKGFDAKKIPKTLRIAVDSSPLEGAGRVEDTINLIGHAVRNVVKCIAELVGRTFEDVCLAVGTPMLLERSVKKALDRDWSDKKQKAEAVDAVAKQVLSLERWIERHLADEADRPPLDRLLGVLRDLMAQDLEPDPNGGGVRIAEGVAKDRRISIEDGEMRHGRKSKSKRIDGYKRHVATDLDSQTIVACAVTPANRPEHEALPQLAADIDAQGIRVAEAHFDRGYMGSPTVTKLEEGGTEILCKPWKSRNGDLFTKEDFTLDLRAKTVTCPAGVSQSITLGKPAQFDATTCNGCDLRTQCTKSGPGQGRTINILEDERLQKRLRTMAKTKAGRERFRQRVPVEHRLAHIGQRQGRCARYFGTRRNLYDLRRAAMIQNLEAAQRKMA